MMRDMLPFLTTVTLVMASFIVGYDRYRFTEDALMQDMQRAFSMTIAQQKTTDITSDTIRTFNTNLSIEALRGKATIVIDTSSDRLVCRPQCSSATIIALSDQRPTLWLATLSLFWAFFWWRKRRRDVALCQAGPQSSSVISLGGLEYRPQTDSFTTKDHKPIALTPMQRDLVRLFVHAENHRLTKTEICRQLWPGKPDASETLYTLIKRIRPVIARQAGLTIVSERGYAYRLEKAEETFRQER